MASADDCRLANGQAEPQFGSGGQALPTKSPSPADGVSPVALTGAAGAAAAKPAIVPGTGEQADIDPTSA